MAAVLPTSAPTEAVAGDTWSWTRAQSTDYPIADGWVLSYAIRGVGRLEWDATWVTNDGTTYTVAVPATATAALVAGTYQIAAHLTLASVRHTVLADTLVVRPDPVQASAGDLRSHYETMLPILDAEIAARITGDGSGFDSLTIEGRSIGAIPIVELRKIRNAYAAAVAASRSNNRLGREVQLHFRRPAAYVPDYGFIP